MVFAIRRQSHKKQDFCRKNFPDKARKSRQFSNLRQMRIKCGFARFWIIQLHFLDDLDTFQIIRKLSRSSGNFQIIQTLSRLSGHISKLSGHLKDRPETFLITPAHFKIIRTLFRLSGHIFEIIWTLFRSYRNFPDQTHSFQIIRTKFLD